MRDRHAAQMSRQSRRIGWLCAIGCAVIWGVLPIYWKVLNPIPSVLIMAYRLVLTWLVLLVVNRFVYGRAGIREAIRKKGEARLFFFGGLLISANWALYIYMVNHAMVIQTSLGYYIEPLFVVLLGVVFYRERPDVFKWIAILLALTGVLVMLIAHGRLPELSLCLAFSFGLYTVVKKNVTQPAMISLYYETVWFLLPAVGYIVYMEATGRGALAVATPAQFGWLALSGPFTAVPLVLFAMAAQRIHLTELGITQYLSPSIGLLLGLALFREPFDPYQFIGFCIIWCGLAALSAGSLLKRKRGV